jgi:hypothetical protein
MRKVIEFNNNKYKTDVEWEPHYPYHWEAKVLKPRCNKRYYDVCFWFSTWIFWWQVIKDNGQYYVWAPGITSFILYEWELKALDIVKFLVKEYKNNNGICIDPELFNSLKQ